MTVFRFVFVVVLIVVSNQAFAVPPHSPDLTATGDLWQYELYRDDDPDHGPVLRNQICFQFIGDVGTHSRYQWFSTVYPHWYGSATQEGDQVVMHGEYLESGIFHDAALWNIVTTNNNPDFPGVQTLGAGHLWFWQEDGKAGEPFGYFNLVIRRIGFCQDQQEPQSSSKEAPNIEQLLKAK